jgi:hypothetical protein
VGAYTPSNSSPLIIVVIDAGFVDAGTSTAQSFGNWSGVFPWFESTNETHAALCHVTTWFSA